MGGFFEELSGAKGLRAEGRSKQNIANFNAEVAEQQAKAELIRSGFNQQRQAEEAERIKSTLRAEIGAAGGAGSPVEVDLTLEQAAELDLENLLIGFEGEVLAGRLKSQATLDRLQGELFRQSGKSAARRANIQFATQIATVAFLAGFGKPKPPKPSANQAASSSTAFA